MSPLLRKEFRALVPIALLLVGIVLLSVTWNLWTEFPDESPIDPNKDVFVGTLITMIFSLLLSAGLLVRESDEGTLAFLDGLPVARTRIYFTKIAAALSVRTAVLLLGYGVGTLYHALSRTSLEVAFPWRTIGIAFGLDWIVGFTILGLGLTLSFFRRWLLVVLGIIAWAFAMAKQLRIPWLKLCDPFALTKPEFSDGRWIIPTPHIVAHVMLGVLGFVCAWLAFRAAGDKGEHLADRIGRRLPVRLLAGCRVIAGPIVWLALIVHFVRVTPPERAAGKDATAGAATTHSETDHYDFLYRESMYSTLDPLIDEADDIYEQVAGFLGGPEEKGLVTVDATSRLADHFAGLAYWKKIRMAVSKDEAPEELAAVLAHETAHVRLEQLGGVRLHVPYVRFFHEGLATYLEYRFFRSEDDLRRLRLVAAVSHSREPVPFESLSRNGEFVEKYFSPLVYPLGEMFCATVVRLYGDAALGNIGRAFARPDAADGLADVILWQDTFQACGYDLEKVLAEFRADLDRCVAQEQDFLNRLPRVNITTTATADEVILHPKFDGERPGKLLCICRPTANAPEYEHDWLHEEEDGCFHLKRTISSGTTFQYQVGWVVPCVRFPLMEPWQNATIAEQAAGQTISMQSP